MPWNDAFAEHFNEIYDKYDPDLAKLCVIVDGMDGDYIMFGEILFDGGDLRWGDTKDSFKTIDFEHLNKEKIRKAFEDELPDFKHLISHLEPQLHIFCHHS